MSSALTYSKGMSADESRRMRESYLRERDRAGVNALRAELRRLIDKCKKARLARRDAIAAARNECEKWKTAARKPFEKKLATCATRKECAPARTGRRVATEKARAGCAVLYGDARAPYDERLERLGVQRESIEDDIRSRTVARRQAAERGRHSAAKARLTLIEKRSEEDEAIERDVAAVDPGLVPVWRKHRRQFKGDAYASRFERFLLWVEETPDVLEAVQTAQSARRDKELGCEQARHEAQRGNRDAAEWAAQNCNGRKRRV